MEWASDGFYIYFLGGGGIEGGKEPQIGSNPKKTTRNSKNGPQKTRRYTSGGGGASDPKTPPLWTRMRKGMKLLPAFEQSAILFPPDHLQMHCGVLGHFSFSAESASPARQASRTT